MGGLVPTCVSDEHYWSAVGKCVGLGSSVCEHLKRVVVTEVTGGIGESLRRTSA